MMTKEVLLGHVPSSPTMIYSIIHIYMKPSQCSRLKYKYYIIHDEVQKGESCSPIYIPTDEQTTDILTKPLSRIKFVYFREKTGIRKILQAKRRYGKIFLKSIYFFDLSNSPVRREHLSLQLKNSPDWTDAFLFRKWIEIFDGQWLPIVVNMGGRLIVDVS